MRISRDAVNPQWGTVNRPARFARSFFSAAAVDSLHAGTLDKCIAPW